MPAARLFIAKTASDIAKSTGFTRFSESARPSYDHSRRSSYIKRRSARTAAAAARMRGSLPGHEGTHDFDGDDFVEHQPDCEMQRPRDASQVELVQVDSRILDLKAMA